MQCVRAIVKGKGGYRTKIDARSPGQKDGRRSHFEIGAHRNLQKSFETVVRLLLDHVCGLESFGALDDVEFDRFALGQRLKSFALDCGVMDEHVIATFLLQETVAL